MSKAQAQRRHFRRRGVERAGVYFGRKAEARIVDDIQAGRARFVRRTSLRATVWDVTVSGGVIRVVYDKQRKSLVTVLPRVKEDA